LDATPFPQIQSSKPPRTPSTRRSLRGLSVPPFSQHRNPWECQAPDWRFGVTNDSGIAASGRARNREPLWSAVTRDCLWGGANPNSHLTDRPSCPLVRAKSHNPL